MKSHYLHRAMWKYGSQIFVVYLNFIAPDSTLMTVISKWFMYGTYFIKFKFRGYSELKMSVRPKKKYLFVLVFIFNNSLKLQ